MRHLTNESFALHTLAKKQPTSRLRHDSGAATDPKAGSLDVSRHDEYIKRGSMMLFPARAGEASHSPEFWLPRRSSDTPQSSSENVEIIKVKPAPRSKRFKLVARLTAKHPKFIRRVRLQSLDPLRQVECTACLSDFVQRVVITLSCQHRYCSECFDRFIDSMSTSQDTYPPRCCNKLIKAKIVRNNTTPDVREHYEAMRLRCKIPIEGRWYCPHAKCSKAFDINKAKVRQDGVECYHCRSRICVDCRGPAHVKGQSCKSSEIVATLRESRRQGWKQCPKCANMIELTWGCVRLHDSPNFDDTD